MMRTSLRAGAAAVGALTVALTAGAFASLPGSGTVAAPSHGSAPALASLRPGTPARAVSGGQVQAAATLANSVTAKQSSNWAGYAAYNGTTTFRLVSAHFTVPYLDCNGVTATDGAWSSHWVGLDGYKSATVEQTGLLAGCNGSTPEYDAWWEMYPKFPNLPEHYGARRECDRHERVLPQHHPSVHAEFFGHHQRAEVQQDGVVPFGFHLPPQQRGSYQRGTLRHTN